MKITHLRTTQFKITVSVYSPARGSRPIYCMRENSRSKIRRVRSGY